MSMRLLRYLRRADIRRAPARLLTRRIKLEAERRFAPRRFAAERIISIAPGLVMSLRPTDQIERAIYLFGLYEYTSATVFVHLVRAGSTVIDAGAHSGQYTLLAAKRAGRVIAVEPNPAVRERLERNVRLNGLENVRIEAVALSDRTGTTQLAIPAGENTGVASLRPATGSDEQIEVRTETLDELLDRAKARTLDVLKLDVEGAEVKVLAGGRRWISTHRPAILFEANELYFGHEETDPTAVALRELGYELYEPSRLRPLAGSGDPRAYREYWMPLNLVALHPARAEEFTSGYGRSSPAGRR